MEVEVYVLLPTDNNEKMDYMTMNKVPVDISNGTLRKVVRIRGRKTDEVDDVNGILRLLREVPSDVKNFRVEVKREVFFNAFNDVRVGTILTDRIVSDTRDEDVGGGL